MKTSLNKVCSISLDTSKTIYTMYIHTLSVIDNKIKIVKNYHLIIFKNTNNNCLKYTL